MHFPAPLDWIRVEDVVREARQDEPYISAKAFWNRWPNKDSFLVDVGRLAVTHDAAPRTMALRELLVDTDATFSERIEALAESVMGELLARPRSYLLGFLAPIMQASASLQQAVMSAAEGDVLGWTEFYDAVLSSVGLRWRPGWDSGRCQVVIQSLIDGLLIRSRLVPELPDGTAWDPVRTFVDAATAMFAAVLDLDADGRPVSSVLDDGVAAARPLPAAIGD